MKIFILFFIVLNSQLLISQSIFNLEESYSFCDSTFKNDLQKITEPNHLTGTKYLDYHSGIKKPFLFNGNFIFPLPISFVNNIKKNRKFHHLVQFVPEIKIRVFQNDTTYNDKSKPVRTPSYIPKISYYLSHKRFFKNQNYTYFGISVLHHSNGQDGDEFNYNDSTINIFDGSFSESLYAHFFLGKKLIFINKTKNCRNQKLKKIAPVFERKSSLYWKLGFEWHPKYFANQKFHLTKLFGGNRIFAQFTFLQNNCCSLKSQNNVIRPYNVESFRIQFNLEYITDLSYYKGNLKRSSKIKFLTIEKRLNASCTFYKKIRFLSNLALFGQIAYFGSDNYNIYFQQSMIVARVGLAVGLFE